MQGNGGKGRGAWEGNEGMTFPSIGGDISLHFVQNNPSNIG